MFFAAPEMNERRLTKREIRFIVLFDSLIPWIARNNMNSEPEKNFNVSERHVLSATGIIVPAAVLILCMHALIVFNTLRINRIGQVISETMQSIFSYTQAAKQFERGADTLTDYARLYIGTGDEVYLSRYFDSLETLHSQDTELGRMISGSQDGAAYAQIAEAQRILQERARQECRAMRLSAMAYGADLTDYPQVAQAVITAEESALENDQLQNAAYLLLSDVAYLKNRSQLHDNIDNAIQAVTAQTSRQIGEHQATLNGYRTLQWVVTVAIIFVLCLMCALLFIYLVLPLKHSVDEVQRGDAIPTNKGLYEIRRLSASYNELLYHKRMLENDLRNQSQTDALTGLPNRLAFENYISRIDWKNTHESITVFSLDVNGLKEKNDTKGHIYGDELLRDGAACILAAFGDETGKNCFRFGGDEFAAFWIGRDQADIPKAISKFMRDQDLHGVSISVGYTYAEDLSKSSVDTLFELADKSMYEEKLKLKHIKPLNAG